MSNLRKLIREARMSTNTDRKTVQGWSSISNEKDGHLSDRKQLIDFDALCQLGVGTTDNKTNKKYHIAKMDAIQSTIKKIIKIIKKK